jgi:hypothetical protein
MRNRSAQAREMTDLESDANKGAIAQAMKNATGYTAIVVLASLTGWLSRDSFASAGFEVTKLYNLSPHLALVGCLFVIILLVVCTLPIFVLYVAQPLFLLLSISLLVVAIVWITLPAASKQEDEPAAYFTWKTLLPPMRA